MQKLPKISFSSLENPYLRAYLEGEYNSELDKKIKQIVQNGLKDSSAADGARPSSNLKLTLNRKEVSPQMVKLMLQQ